MSTIHVLHIANDHLLELQELIDTLTGIPLSTAAVTVTVVDAQGLPVLGEVWPKPMAAVAGSPGTYRATLVNTLVLAKDKRYTARITADAGAGLKARWDMDCVARVRA